MSAEEQADVERLYAIWSRQMSKWMSSWLQQPIRDLNVLTSKHQIQMLWTNFGVKVDIEEQLMSLDVKPLNHAESPFRPHNLLGQCYMTAPPTYHPHKLLHPLTLFGSLGGSFFSQSARLPTLHHAEFSSRAAFVPDGCAAMLISPKKTTSPLW